MTQTQDATTTDTRHRTGIFGWSPQDGGVHYFRIAEPLRVLAEHGSHTVTGTDLTDATLAEVDHVLVHMIHDERNSEALETLARLDTHKIIYDCDDAMWEPDWHVFKDHYGPAELARFYRNVSLAHVVTTPSPVIAEHLCQYNRNVWVLPNTIPAWLTEHTMPARHAPTIGYQGSPSHARDFTSPIERGLSRFLLDEPDWRLHLYGGIQVGGAGILADRIDTFPWVGKTGWPIDDYWRALSFDVGIGPLRDTYFNRCKSSLRAVEYAALGIVACLPDLPPYRGWVEDGVTGRLIPPGRTLRGVLTEIARDTAGRITMAANARARAAAWTTEANIDKWVTAWASQ